jgi:hypothetical protein
LVGLLDLVFPPEVFTWEGRRWATLWKNPLMHRDVSKRCRIIAARGGVKWVCDTRLVARITNARTLCSRLYNAQKALQSVRIVLTHDGEPIPVAVIRNGSALPTIVKRSSISGIRRWERKRDTTLMVGRKLHK